jgi:alpha-L-fucosidase 2
MKSISMVNLKMFHIIKKRKVLLCLILLFLFPRQIFADTSHLVLKYDQPATDWEKEALPLGNGRIGAMVFGGVDEELITLNEDTLWSGSPYEWDSSAGRDYLPNIRRLVLSEQFNEAAKLVRKLQGAYSQSYMPLGNMRLKFFNQSNTSDYQRSLDISDAVVAVRYKIAGHEHRRRVFVSYPDQVLVVQLESDAPEGLSFTATLDSLLEHKLSPVRGVDYSMRGHAPIHVAPSYQQTDKPVIQQDEKRGTGMRFCACLRVRHVGGEAKVDEKQMTITNAKQVTLLVAIDTSFNGFDKLPDSQGIDETIQPGKDLEAAISLSDEELFERHRKDYRQLFERVTLDFGNHQSRDILTPERLRAATEGINDPDLAVLLFQYGRYLLIASSRTGTQPANLQGIWNDKLRPPWSSNYTVNINTEMNYWLAEPTNLSELHEPLLKMIEELAVTGRTTAKVTYGMHGWCAHHNTDLWRLSCPVGNYGEGDPVWANWQMGGPWLCQHLWEHYQFTHDEKFLRERAYPVMKGAAEFLLDYLVQDSNGHLVTIPSTSPENKFIWNGQQESVSMGSTSDMALTCDLLTNLIEASEILNLDADFRETLIGKRDQLLPLKVSPRGTLLEWYRDFEETDPHHRHVSHLIALHSGKQISPLLTPDLAAAARRTLEARGDEGTGWSLAWKINFWARLHDGNHAHRLLSRLLRPTGIKDTKYDGGGGVYLNLLDAHPPFQIDGNFGAANGICEMLVQSHLKAEDDTVLVYLLPALPTAWPNGKVTGLRIRSGAEIDLEWNGGQLSSCRIRGLNEPVTLKYGEKISRTDSGDRDVHYDGALKPTG